MPNVIGKVPEFTEDEATQPSEVGTEEVKEVAVEETVEEEKETPTEPPAEEKPAEQTDNLPGGDIRDEKEKQIRGLKEEKQKLLQEIIVLRGQRREIKQEELVKVQKEIDELKDLNPEDVATFDRILKAKGYVTKGEANQMYYGAVKQQELDGFLSKYPEYKAENDTNDINWNALQRELKDYKWPDNPHDITRILEKAHRAISRISDDRSTEVKKRQVEVASVGGGGTQRSTPTRISLDPDKRAALERGGWSEEEILKIENKLA